MVNAVATLRDALERLYGERAIDTLGALLSKVEAAKATVVPPPGPLEADWHQQPRRLGYAAYVDRFAGDLQGVAGRIGYLEELGVDLVHLMSVLRPRGGENDGGFAIADYREPDPRLGTAEDLRSLATSLHQAGIRLCLDLVLNHTSDDHEWARLAREGSTYHRALYLVYRNRTLPDAYERTLPEVFPELSPGNFTWVEDMGGWVWTTFHDFQWDLNWSNPDVLLEIVDIVFHLVGLGVDVLRLDAIAFTWKRLGTNCQNQPEAHLIARVLRTVLRMAAPWTHLLAEAIVAPSHLLGYLDNCDLAYNNQLMVMGWSMVAEKRSDLATAALRHLGTPPPRSTWLTYVRCHDDIGWAVDDADAASVGLSGPGHRAFLAAFYRGDFYESFARGVPFSTDPERGDERTCGMTSTLCGIAAGDPMAHERFLLLYGLAMGYGGIPLVWMGDELALGDGPDGADSRSRQRPVMDWDLAERRGDPSTREGRAWAGLRRLIEARAGCPALHGAATTVPLDSGHPQVFAWLRHHPTHGVMVGLANVGTLPATADAGLLEVLGDKGPLDLLDPGAVGALTALAPLQVRWCVPA